MSSISVSAADISAERRQADRLSRVFTLAYGAVCYLTFPLTILYAVGFVGNWLVPKSIDAGTVRPPAPSLLINAGLLGLFAVQHTIMARPAFKRWWTRIIPKSIERSTFVLLASGCLNLLFWQWRPLPQDVWSLGGPAGVMLAAASLFGWAVVLVASFTISHFDLFGLRQVWMRFRGRPYAPVGFRLAGLYQIVRHPLMVGFLIAFWATPRMSVGHLFFAILTSGYILFGTWIEERDLIAEHGERYLNYKKRVRGLFPLPMGRA